MNYTLNEARFWSQVEKIEGGCWLWRGGLSPQGYGLYSVKIAGRGWIARRTHRIVIELAGIEIPRGYEVDHLCLSRACLNRAHLEIVSGDENRWRMILRRNPRHATHCRRGHARTPENTRKGGRTCRICEGRLPVARRDPERCRNGHRWTPETTKITKTGRTCRICHRATAHRRRGESVARPWEKQRPQIQRPVRRGAIPFHPAVLRLMLVPSAWTGGA